MSLELEVTLVVTVKLHTDDDERITDEEVREAFERHMNGQRTGEDLHGSALWALRLENAVKVSSDTRRSMDVWIDDDTEVFTGDVTNVEPTAWKVVQR